MRKKRLSAVGITLAVAATLFAYNPPVGGENLFRFGHTDLTSQTASAAGGAIFSTTPQSIVINPALIAESQRVSVDIGCTGLFPTKDSGAKIGMGLQLGALFPTRWGVAAASLHAAFLNNSFPTLGDTLLARAAFARDVADNLYVGISLFGGVNGGWGSTWAAGVDLGVWYSFGAVGPLRDLRAGVALANLGKTFDTDIAGIKGGDSESFPGRFTPRIGVASTFLDLNKFDAGFSFDVSVPFFQNFILDAGVQARFAEIVTVSLGWQFNATETIKDYASLFPSIGLSVKFKWNSSKSEFLSSKGWDTSDITASGNWRQIYDGVQQISAGVTANFGLPDTDGPSISLWGE
jgi:hypothetical protein